VPRLFERVTIAGVGLIGGSLALSARAAGLIGEVTGLGRSLANLETARQLGIVDHFTQDPIEAVRHADLLLLAVPVRSLAAVASACAPALPRHAIVSDVGSVKASVARDVEAVLPDGVAFVGAHPIAGTEDSGAAAARADLFTGRRCLLTPSPSTTPASLQKVRALWEGVGMRVDEIDAERHDRALAWVSHLPHALAFSAVNAILSEDASLHELGGSSFRDLTRVAASAPQTWRDIFLANRDALSHSIDRFIDELLALRTTLHAGDEEALMTTLQRAERARRTWGTPT